MKKKAINEMKLNLISNSRNESFARYVVTAFAAQLDPTVEELADIRTVVSEAVTNCVVHGYRGTSGIITVTVRLFSDRTIHIKVKDRGVGIADIAQAMQPLYTTDEAGERGGMGFTIMKSFTNSLDVKSRVGKGTVVTMIKRFSPKTEA